MEENPSTLLTNGSIFIKYIFCPPSLKARDDTVDSDSLVKIWQESIPALAQTNLPCGKANVHFSFTTSTLSLSGNPSWWCDKRGPSSHPGAERLLWPTDGQASTGHRSTNSTLLCAMSVSNNVTHSGVPSPCYQCRPPVNWEQGVWLGCKCTKLHFVHFLNWIYINTSHNSFTVFPPATLSLGADTNQIIMWGRQLKVTRHRFIGYAREPWLCWATCCKF